MLRIAFATSELTLYRMVMPIGTPFLKEKINNRGLSGS